MAGAEAGAGRRAGEALALRILQMEAGGAGGYFDRVHDAYLTARAVEGEVVQYFEIASLKFHLECAGTAPLRVVGRALAHLETPGFTGPADLTVRVWDAASAGVALPHCPSPIE